LPFLIEPIGDRYVAFLPDRSNFVDPDYPYLLAIDGVAVDEWCATAAVLEPSGSEQFVKRQSLRHLRYIDHWRRERGLPVAQQLNVRLISDDEKKSREKTFSTAQQQPIYGTWPKQESRRLEGNIGYLRLPSMNHSAEGEILEWMPRFQDTVGLVVDVRGNGGGSRAALRQFFVYLMAPDDSPRVVNCAKYRLHPDFGRDHLDARYLYRADSPQWTSNERQAIEEFRTTFEPQWQPPAGNYSEWHYMVLNRLDDAAVYHYSKPVVVLMDAKCFSATDIFLAGLKGWRNVTLVGTASSGGSARSVSSELPGVGIRLRLASMVSFQSNGSLYDGNGVAPDILVLPTPDYFLGKEDKQLTRARKIIENQD